MKVLVTGGSGSGKSVWAEKLIKSLNAEHKYYIATMQVYDDESVKRVERHRLQRAELGMETIERAKGLNDIRLEPDCAVLIEDIPNLLANEMFDGGNPDKAVDDIRTLLSMCKDAVIVTNDVFSDGVEYAEGTREYIQRLAKINSELANLCDSVIEVVYSIPVSIKGAIPCV